nr:zinc finger, CCHC-type [Tanacetum cinerariifolium]
MVNSMLSYSGLSVGFLESRDAIFDEERFTSIPRPRGMIQPSSSKIIKDEVEGTRDKTVSLREYCYIIEEDPRTLSESMASRDVVFWKEAIQSEIDSIMHNDTWELTDLPPGCKALGCKWILKRKMKVDGSIDKYKARLVIQGFRQKEGIDFFDTYDLVDRITTIRLLLALAAIHDLVIHQMDVKTAFLNGDLDEEIYMKQPEGFVMSGHENKVRKLKKSLYGLKQAPKQWHQKFDEVVLSNGFSLNQADKCVYSRFGDSDLGEAEVILGIRIKRGNNVSQLEYSRAVGCLMYAMISTRSDIAFAVGKLSSGYPSIIEGYSDASWINDTEDHSSMSGWVFLLGRGAICWASKKQTCITGSTMESEFVALAAAGNEAEWQRNLVYEIPLWHKPVLTISIRCDNDATLVNAYTQVNNEKSRHLGYSDASWINNTEDHSSTSGWVFLLGGCAICWASKKQTCITGSTMESEFVALAAAGNEAEWLRKLVYEIPLWPKPVSTISIRCDNDATLANAYTQVYNGKSRHLGVRHSMIRELIKNGVISVEFIKT